MRFQDATSAAGQPASQPPGPSAETPPDPREAVDLIFDKLNGWLELAIAKLPNLVVAVLVVLAFALIARLVGRLLGRALRHTPLPQPVRNLFITATRIVVLVAGVFIALGILGLDKTVGSLLAGVGIVGLALGFAFQDIAANFMSGILISFRRPFTVGQIVETNGFFGTVDEINLRSTVIRRPTGQLVLIPNKQVFENPIINFSQRGERRVDLDVGVAYGDDLEKARRVAVEAVEGLDSRDRERPVELFYTGFGDSSINFVVRFWIDFEKQKEFLAARSEAIMRIKAAFDRDGITIPFPIRTLDFGIVGGEHVSEALAPVLRGGGQEAG